MAQDEGVGQDMVAQTHRGGTCWIHPDSRSWQFERPSCFGFAVRPRGKASYRGWLGGEGWRGRRREGRRRQRSEGPGALRRHPRVDSGRDPGDSMVGCRRTERWRSRGTSMRRGFRFRTRKGEGAVWGRANDLRANVNRVRRTGQVDSVVTTGGEGSARLACGRSGDGRVCHAGGWIRWDR